MTTSNAIISTHPSSLNGNGISKGSLPRKMTLPIAFPSLVNGKLESEPERLVDDSTRGAYERVAIAFGPTKSEEKGGLTDQEKIYLSREAIVRFLVADNWDVKLAIARLEKTLAWRRDFGLWDIEQMAKDIEGESLSGKCMTFSYTSSGLPIVFLTPSKNTTDPSEASIKNVVFVMERALELMLGGVERIVFHMDMGGEIQRRPGMIGLWKDQLSIFRTYYPERMGHAYVTSFPFVTRVLVTLIWPFVDAKTKEKVTFDAILGKQKEIGKSVIQGEYGGDIQLEYNRDVYLPELMKICKRRREAMMAKWKRVGGGVGVPEKYFMLSGEEAAALETDAT